MMISNRKKTFGLHDLYGNTSPLLMLGQTDLAAAPRPRPEYPP